MVLVLGSSGYVGSKICQYLDFQGIPFATFSLRFNIGNIEKLDHICRTTRVKKIINCSAYVGEKSIDECEVNVGKTEDANVYCVWNIVEICKKYNITLTHVSTGCIFDGDKSWDESADPFFGESVYNRTKIEAEKIVSTYDNIYICRLRLPFDFLNHPKNFITKMMKFNKVGDQPNSITNLNDFALIAVELSQQKHPFGTYNIVNPGKISAHGIKSILQEYRFISDPWTILDHNDPIFNLRANTTLSSRKILHEGFVMDEVGLSIRKSLDNWDDSTTNVFW